MDNTRTLRILADALQAVFEAVDTAAAELPPDRRGNVRSALYRVRQARTELLALHDDLL